MSEGANQSSEMVRAWENRRWRDLARISAESITQIKSIDAFVYHIFALRGLQRFDLIDALCLHPGVVAEDVHSMFAVRNAADMLDFCEYLRRANAHVARFGANYPKLMTEIDRFCNDLRLTDEDIVRLSGGTALLGVLPTARPQYRRKPIKGKWMAYARPAMEIGDYRAAETIFFTYYDWACVDFRMTAFAALLFGKGGANRKTFVSHLMMAAYQNGDRSLPALEEYVARLFGLGRTAEVLRTIAFQKLTARLEFYRILSLSDLGLISPGETSDNVAYGEDIFSSLVRLRDSRRPSQTVIKPHRRLEQGRRLKFALCISGQMRGNYQGAADMLEMFRAEGDVDVFVATWKDPGALALDRKHITRNFTDEVAEYFNSIGGDILEVVTRILPKFARVEDPAEFAEKVRSVFGTEWVLFGDQAEFEAALHDLFPDLEPALVNQYKMFYQIYNANKLRLDHSPLGDDYDYVVRLRPDVSISKINFEEIYSKVGDDDVVCSNMRSERGFTDVFAIGRPHAMNRYANVWEQMAAGPGHYYLPGANQYRMAEWHLLRHLFVEGCSPVALKETGHLRAWSHSFTDAEVLDSLYEVAKAAPLSAEQAGLLSRLQDKYADRIDQQMTHAGQLDVLLSQGVQEAAQ